MASPHIFCGLGNPGPRYDGTRHNVGFAVADLLRDRHGGRWAFPDPTYAICRASVRGHEVLLVKPQTYMNLSGDALLALSRAHDIDWSTLIVACDDIALPEGQIRVRRKGGDGGHNGLKSIAATLSTPAFARIRMGVGMPPEGVDASDYVLDAMDADSATVAAAMVRQAVRCVEVWLESGLNVAMNRFNQRERSVPPTGVECEERD